MENAGGHVKFQNNYNRVHVQLSGNCKMWRSNVTSEDGGWLSTDVLWIQRSKSGMPISKL